MIVASLHILSVVFCTVAAALGVVRGQGSISRASLSAMNRQPSVKQELRRSMLIALALVETASILGLLLSFLLLRSGPTSLGVALAQLGIAISIGVPGLVLGWSLSGPITEALFAMARQPFLTRRLTNFMLFIVSILETAVIFGFIIALLIYFGLPGITTTAQGYIYLGAGIAVGIGTVGPIIGGCNFITSSFAGAGKNRTAFRQLSTFTFASQAIIETPIIFATIIAFILTSKAPQAFENPIIGICYLVFGALMGVGTFGSGISSGRVAAAAARQISLNPQESSSLSRASLMAQGLIDTCAVYAFIIALWLVITPLI